MISKFATLLVLIFTYMKNAHLLQQQCIFSIIKEFNLNNPYLIGSIDNKIEFFKLLSKNGHFSNIHSRIEQSSVNGKITTNSIILFKSQAKYYYQLDFSKNPYWSYLLISNDTKFEEFLNTIAAHTDINQKVFILKEDSHDIYEAYKINNVAVKKKLGHIDLVANKFKWQTDVNHDFIKRRSNLFGIVLKGIVGFSGLNMFAKDPKYREKAPYFSVNKTYQVNGFTDGLFHDILMTLQDQLNFTSVLYKRKEDNFGGFNSKNGTFKAIGMLGDIFSKRVDIGVSSFAMTRDRANFVDYLVPISFSKYGIFIPISNTEKIDFETYFVPFSHILWITVALTGVTFAAWRFFLLKAHGCENIFGFDHIWASFSGFFGGTPAPTPIDEKSSYITMIIATLLCGTIVWIAYQTSLTSELAIREKKYPFYDMESFSKTNWR